MTIQLSDSEKIAIETAAKKQAVKDVVKSTAIWFSIGVVLGLITAACE